VGAAARAGRIAGKVLSATYAIVTFMTREEPLPHNCYASETKHLPEAICNRCGRTIHARAIPTRQRPGEVQPIVVLDWGCPDELCGGRGVRAED
jgi:hypothetical protein